MPGSAVIHGISLDDGGVRLQDSKNDDAWIEVEYRDGWFGRKVMTDDKTAYEKMVHPYLYECAACHRYRTTERWGAGSKYCSHCEQRMEIMGVWFERTENGIAPDAKNRCPSCGSTELQVGIVVDLDSKCKDCGEHFNIQEAATA